MTPPEPGAAVASDPGRLRLTGAVDGRALLVRPTRLILAGYTGRDREQVQRHIDELAAEGIPPPERIPDLYPGIATAVQIGGRLAAGSGWSSGEVEYVLIVTQGSILVGVGSDHTDRQQERTAVIASKQAFSKVIGPKVWPLDALAGTWDSFTLRSWITHRGARTLYQEGSMGHILAPRDLLALLSPQDRGDGLVLFSGTVPATQRAPTEGVCRFEGEIVAADGRVIAACEYEYQAAGGTTSR